MNDRRKIPEGWDTGAESIDSQDDFKVVGHSPERVDALKLALGKGTYADDVDLDGMLYLKVLWSPHAHAIIKSIDTSKAEAVPGVELILHHGNVSRIPYTTAGQGHPEPSPYDIFIFDRKVRWVGDRVACVAATSERAAARAVELIEVEYELLEPIFDSRRSADEGAPVLHDQPEATGLPDYEKDRNIAAQMLVEHGDMEKAFASADLVLEREYSVPYQAHCCLEPHVALTWLDEDNRLVVRVATQVPFHSRRILARILEIPLNRIRVIKPRIGGGFGGKQEILLEDLPALVTLRTGKPARLMHTRSEEFCSSRTRHPQRLRWKTGVMKDGTIVAQELEVLANTGANGAHALTVQSCTAGKTLPLYDAEAYRFIMKTVYTNLPPGGAFRGYGGPQGFMAMETHMDEVADKLGMDPIAFRRMNVIAPGHDNVLAKSLGEGKEGPPQRIRSNAIQECIDRGAAAIGWERRDSLDRDGPIKRGMGMTCLMHGSGIPGVDMASARIKLNEDGSFNLHVGATDIGTGSDTILSQIAAEALSVPLDKIVIYSSDTDHTPFDTGAYASSTTFISGQSVKKAAEGAGRQLREAALEMWRVHGKEKKLDDLRLEDGHVRAADGDSISYADICLSTFYEHDQHQIQDHGSHMTFECPPPFSAHFCEVEVDTETGGVKLLKYVAAVDCGVAIHPASAEGQTEGGAVTSMGYALSEDYIFDEKGKLLSDSFGDYKQFTALDAPDFETILVKSFEPAGPFGAKSVSEIPADGPGPTIANAIANAIGIRFRDLPITPEKVRRAWLDQQSSGE
ncbi:MAG: molybdopterin-dependent oxidoreductase [Deltaproteobacteria bacterium]|nr:molybdopterin-dependent oxidoreductase [Deltaproteobacteria bacterium]